MFKRLLYLAAGLAILASGLITSSTMANAATGSFTDGPYASHSPDSGTCGNNWAVDLFSRKFTANLPANPDGSYTVTEKFLNGQFITHGSGPGATTPPTSNNSPGACQSGPPNGHTLQEGIAGTLTGKFTINVTGGTFNPSGSCVLDPEGECTTSAWITAFFGGSASHTIPHFKLVYTAPSTVLLHSWTNADTGNVGDIATA